MSQSMSSDVIKIGFVISIAFSFPLVIFPCRASLYSLLYRQGHSDANPYIPENKFRAITTVIVFASLLVSLVIPSVELVIGLVGSTIGIAICIVFPSCCFTKVSKKDSTEKLLAKIMIVGGFCLMVLGTYANLSAIDGKSVSVTHLQAVPEAHVHLKELNLDDKFIGLESNLNAVEEEKKKLEYTVVKLDGEGLKLENKKGEELINEEIEAKKKQMLIDEGKEQVEKEKKVLNKDAIEKEVEEELTDKKDAKAVVQEELHAVVDELRKQNEESQKKVLEKVEEILEKIEQKLEPEGERDKVHSLEKHVEDQVKDMFPDPIPLRDKGNNSKIYGSLKLEVGAVVTNPNNSAVNLDENVKVEEKLPKEEDDQGKVLMERAVFKGEIVEAKVQKSNIVDNNKQAEEVKEKVDVIKKEEVEGKKLDEDVDAIRRDLLNVNIESLARLKRDVDCKKEI